MPWQIGKKKHDSDLQIREKKNFRKSYQFVNISLFSQEVKTLCAHKFRTFLMIPDNGITKLG
jgi:hypothetical protein